MEQNFKHFTALEPTEVYKELQAIKRDLGWLDDDIALTKQQREIFCDIKNRVKNLLGYSK